MKSLAAFFLAYSKNQQTATYKTSLYPDGNEIILLCISVPFLFVFVFIFIYLSLRISYVGNVYIVSALFALTLDFRKCISLHFSLTTWTGSIPLTLFGMYRRTVLEMISKNAYFSLELNLLINRLR